MTKLHRLNLSAIICFLALFIFTSHANALFDSNVDKANEFMQAGMYPQAIALLEKEINDNPTNAEAHFQLGICYVNQSNYSSADERFASAVRLKPDYGYKIGKEYKKAAEYNLKKGRVSSVRALYDKAIEYDPSLERGVAQKLFQKGKQKGNDQLFSLALSYDSKLKNTIADYYYSLSKNNQGEASLSLLAKALQYSDKYRKKFDEQKLKIGTSFLNEAKRLAKIADKSKVSEEYKKKAIKYLGKDAVWEVLYDYKIYQPGEYTFSLKAGEMTEHWIKLPSGVDCNFSSLTNGKFEVVFKDGVRKNQNNVNGDYYNTSPFKIISKEEQLITIKITR